MPLGGPAATGTAPCVALEERPDPLPESGVGAAACRSPSSCPTTTWRASSCAFVSRCLPLVVLSLPSCPLVSLAFLLLSK